MPATYQRLGLARLWIVATIVVGIATAFVVGCTQDRPMPTASMKPAVTRVDQLTGRVFHGSSRRRPAEDQSVRHTNEIPGFGGLFISSSHEFVAYVKDTTVRGTLAASAVQALKAHLASDGFGVPRRIPPTTVRTLRAGYDWQTLSSYRDFIADSLMGSDGVVIVAIDVVNNRVSATVASTNASAESQLKQALSRHQIPLAAIEIARGAAPRSTVARAPSVPRLPFASTLQDSEPAALMGGIMIRVPSPEIGGYNDFCSIGAVVDSAGTKKLLSASHCSRTLWSLQGDSVETFDTSLIGHETTDKTAGTGYRGLEEYTHRGSDAALWSMDATYGAAHAMLGVIARTTSRDSSGLSDTMNHTLDSSSPYLYIYDTLTSSSLVVGEEVDKVGALSGWQHGRLANTCVDFFDDDHHDRECFSEVGSLSITGDSGGPVFIWDGEDGATLIGIQEGVDLSYAHSDSSGLVSYFSNWSAIVTENGLIDPRMHTTVGAPSPSGSVSGGQAIATWSAVSTTNTSATTQYEIYESIWDASTQSWTDSQQYVGSTPYLTYTDASPWTIYTAADGQPDQCSYSSVGIEIGAYNAGVYTPGGTVWFQGPANGPPGCRAFRAPLRKPGK